MDALSLRDPSTVLATYYAHDGEHDVVMLSLPSGFWLVDERRAPEPLSEGDRLLAAALPTEQVARESARRYLADARRRGRPLAPTFAELDDRHKSVCRLARGVGRRFGIEGDELRDLTRAAELHDIGKLAIPEAILRKPGPLTDGEWELVRRHTTAGERFLASMPGLGPAARLVRWSHERYDGNGYPDGLAADEIPLGARIICACDAYAAMRSDRPYRKGMSHRRALAELRRHSGTQFDPSVVETLCAELAASAAAGGPGRPASRSSAGGSPRRARTPTPA